MVDFDTILGFAAFMSIILGQFFAVIYSHRDPLGVESAQNLSQDTSLYVASELQCASLR